MLSQDLFLMPQLMPKILFVIPPIPSYEFIQSAAYSSIAHS